MNFDVIVAVRSVHLMERPHSVENLVLNPPNNLILRARGETTVTTPTQYDGLSSSNSAILTLALLEQAQLSAGGMFGGEAE